MISKLAAMRAAPRFWRRVSTARRVMKAAGPIPGAGVAFTRVMYRALRARRFTGEDEKEGRKRWVAVYDASVKVLRALPFVKK